MDRIRAAQAMVHSHQIVSNFTFVPLPMLSVSHLNATNTALTWPVSIMGFTLQSITNLDDATWSYVQAQVNRVNGSNQALVPSSSGTRYYRLVT